MVNWVDSQLDVRSVVERFSNSTQMPAVYHSTFRGIREIQAAQQLLIRAIATRVSNNDVDVLPVGVDMVDLQWLDVFEEGLFTMCRRNWVSRSTVGTHEFEYPHLLDPEEAQQVALQRAQFTEADQLRAIDRDILQLSSLLAAYSIRTQQMAVFNSICSRMFLTFPGWRRPNPLISRAVYEKNLPKTVLFVDVRHMLSAN